MNKLVPVFLSFLFMGNPAFAIAVATVVPHVTVPHVTVPHVSETIVPHVSETPPEIVIPRTVIVPHANMATNVSDSGEHQSSSVMITMLIYGTIMFIAFLVALTVI